MTDFSHHHIVASEHTDTKTVAQADQSDTQRSTMALPNEVYEALRQAAFDRRITQAQVVTEALRVYLGLL